MNYKINHRCIQELSIDSIEYRINTLNTFFLLLLFICYTSCSDFVEVDPPKNVLISETVFDDPATVESALANIFYELREEGMVSGNFGLTSMMGIYSDELDYYGFEPNSMEMFYHNVSASNSYLLQWWSHAFNLIYAANDVIDGVENSNTLNPNEKAQYKGQAFFVRAYLHSLLSDVFGEIPYITTTDYLENDSVVRQPITSVNEQIILDLNLAVDLLEGYVGSSERVLPNQSVAKALLARMYLYTNNWELAEEISSDLIAAYILEPDLSKVFLKESSETIWQFKPGDNPKNTMEANQFIIQLIPGQQFALTNTFLNGFEQGDLRLSHWVGSASSSDGTTTLYYPYKYKAYITETQSLEYSIVFRLAEQYLIRAEARAHLGDISGAQDDLNRIRNRAGLQNTSANSQNSLLEAIWKERRVELFTEQGLRWFDLKRTGTAGKALEVLKPNWKETDALFPIPESELEINPNLLPQNVGY
ncbi:RagB/SusD family nutrient uptake outer membrane protein [Formosa haliotis]|uniref:RagB/SusD family nutrient uptake outer membrane protein n=1 Tax=Formosa haliotis TaxID=1555194 RepID=UPI00082695DB|nr:RagB/SusD family nutrient uptake outer membrane protein [Formosa haliotis]